MPTIHNGAGYKLITRGRFNEVHLNFYDGDDGQLCIPFDGTNRHFREFWAWNEKQPTGKKISLSGIEIWNPANLNGLEHRQERSIVL